jgi:outer membrane protein TolC
MSRRAWVLIVVALSLAPDAGAQTSGPPTGAASDAPSAPRPATGTGPAGPSQTLFLGSVPGQPLQAAPLPLTIADAIQRALKYNLGVLTLEQQVASARGARWRSLTGLLPNVQARANETRETVNLAALGFDASLFPGIPSLVGPFNVFDARVSVAQPVVDLSALNDVRRAGHALDAARFESRSSRDLVVLVVANLYLQAVAGASRIDAARAQVTTAEALLQLANNQRSAGVVPAIDALRAQVQRDLQRQRLIAAENAFAKEKLDLARAIGIPVAQQIELIDRVPYSAMVPLTLEQALHRATDARADYQAALARVRAAQADRRAVQTELLPSLRVSADVGTIGPSPSETKRTYSMLGLVRVPLFEGGRHQGRVLETEAALREREAEAQDFAQRIESDVRRAWLDLQAAEQQLTVARGVVDLANAELAQAQNRFQAGVTSNLEVVQAQESVATAAENQIDSLYAHNLAKVALARAMGVAEDMASAILGVRP